MLEQAHLSSPSAAAAECGGCLSGNPFLLFHVKVHVTYSHLCPSCVLKSHPTSFCPICLEVYDDVPPPSLPCVRCLKCRGFAHAHCVSPEALPTYHCPPCADPSFLFFRLQPAKQPDTTLLDKDSAKALVAAARIAHSSIAKAATNARSEADKGVREAAFARKRAREAIERVNSLAMKEWGNGNQTLSLSRDLKRVALTPQSMQTPNRVQSGLPQAGITAAVSRPFGTTPHVVQDGSGLQSVSPIMRLQSASQNQQARH